MKSILYKGYHSQKAFNLFKKSYNEDSLIIFLPPLLTDYSFVSLLPKGSVELQGELWESTPQVPNARGENYSVPPVAGVFSSGTTKESKLILYSKENMTSSVFAIFELFDRERVKNIFCYPQPFHTFGLTLGYAASHLLGLNLQFADGKYSLAHHELWKKFTGPENLTLGTPTHYYDLLQWQSEQSTQPQTSYSCIIGGAKVKKNL